VARKHAAKLRVIVWLAGFAAPVLLVLLASVLGRTTALLVLALALPLNWLGAFVERWLFFAQARHTVNLYYGDAAV
jgi:DMSO reductase anchor subunit